MSTAPNRISGITAFNTAHRPSQGQWTYQDYLALPDDGQRYEIVDGVLFIMAAAPKRWHQKTALKIAHLFLRIRFHFVP